MQSVTEQKQQSARNAGKPSRYYLGVYERVMIERQQRETGLFMLCWVIQTASL